VLEWCGKRVSSTARPSDVSGCQAHGAIGRTFIADLRSVATWLKELRDLLELGADNDRLPLRERPNGLEKLSIVGTLAMAIE